MKSSEILRIQNIQSVYWNLRTESKNSYLRRLINFFRHHTGIVLFPKVNLKNNHGIFSVNRKLMLGKANEFGSYRSSDLIIHEGGSFIVDNFTFYTGFQISVNSSAKLIIGSGYAMYNIKIDCFKEVIIGQNVAISHNVIIRDSDNHSISGQREKSIPIRIGNHVWVGMNAIILKGVNIGDGSVIAAGSVVTHDVPERTLVAGVPAKVIRKNVDWE